LNSQRLIVFSLLVGALLSTISLILSFQLFWLHRIFWALGILLVFLYYYFHWKAPRWFFNLLALFNLIICVIWGIWFAPYPILSVYYFLGYLVLVRLFEVETSRDFKLTLFLSFLEISSASLLVIGLRYFLLFFAWLCLALFALSLIIIAGEQKKPIPGVKVLFAEIFSASVFSIIFGVFIFFFLPRLGFSIIGFPLYSRVKWSGYSDSITLGTVNRILQNRKIVMRVKLRGRKSPLPGIRWRAKSLDLYQNNSWSDNLGIARVYHNRYNHPIRVFDKNLPGEKIFQEFFIEPGYRGDLPSAGIAVYYSIPIIFSNLYFTYNQYSTLNYASLEPFYYYVEAILAHFTPEMINEALSEFYSSYPGSFPGYFVNFLQLPSESEPVCQLAKQVSASYPDYFSKIQALKNYLNKNYHYSSSELPGGENPVYEFLFVKKKGNCEYFATAMVLMLRCLGIPSRLAIGYIGGEWNSYQDYYLVRESDAHAWAEVVLPGLGFMEVDATPASVQRRQAGSFEFYRFIDPLIFRWNRWIVDFSVQDQLRVFRRWRAKQWGVNFYFNIHRSRILDRLRAHRLWAGIILLCLIILSLFIVMRRDRKANWQVSWKKTGKNNLVQKLYLKMFKKLKKAGLKVLPSYTGLELARNFPLDSEERKVIEEITWIYYSIRFGGAEINKEKIKSAWNQLRDLKMSRK